MVGFAQFMPASNLMTCFIGAKKSAIQLESTEQIKRDEEDRIVYFHNAAEISSKNLN